MSQSEQDAIYGGLIRQQNKLVAARALLKEGISKAGKTFQQISLKISNEQYLEVQAMIQQNKDVVGADSILSKIAEYENLGAQLAMCRAKLQEIEKGN